MLEFAIVIGVFFVTAAALLAISDWAGNYLERSMVPRCDCQVGMGVHDLHCPYSATNRKEMSGGRW